MLRRASGPAASAASTSAIRVKGRGAHSGDPGNGINAIEEALPLLNALAALKAQVEPPGIRDAAPAAFRRPAPDARGSPSPRRMAGRRARPCQGCSTVLVNRRYAPEESFDEVPNRNRVDDRGGAEVLACPRRRRRDRRPSRPGARSRWPALAALAGGGRPMASAIAPSSSAPGVPRAAPTWVGCSRPGSQEILLGGLSRPESSAAWRRTNSPRSPTSWRWRTAILVYLSRRFPAESTTRSQTTGRYHDDPPARPSRRIFLAGTAVLHWRSPAGWPGLRADAAAAAASCGVSVDQAVGQAQSAADAGEPRVPCRGAALQQPDAGSAPT